MGCATGCLAARLFFAVPARPRQSIGCNHCPSAGWPAKIISYSPQFGHRKEEGSILGGLGNLLDGDGFKFNHTYKTGLHREPVSITINSVRFR